jgi:TPP-dependent pyruvate/acetoin dehydrogenase alpha subunit
MHTISFTLTQLPKTAGAGYALKRMGGHNCVACHFGTVRPPRAICTLR